MDDQINYRVKQWTPPARPEWVRCINEEGSYLDLKSVVPLDEDSLIAHAKANTGLSDFGSDDWYEPFKVYIKALEQESELTLMGRLMTRSDVLIHLEGRLHVEDTYKRHPEIDAEKIKSPIMIVGSGRCGSSAMQNLLSHDPDNGTPRQWEAMFPCPPPEKKNYLIDPRIHKAEMLATQWNRVTPEIMSMHEFGGSMPTELIHIETMSFQSASFLDLYGLVPSYDAYMSTRSQVPALNYAKRVLKLLQWKNPHLRWSLKSPDTMRYLPDLFTVFPDVQVVWMHRDPIKAVASFVGFIGTLFWIRSDQPLSEEAIGHLTNPVGLALFFDKVIDEIEQGKVPAAQFHHVHYQDLMKDQLGTIEKLYGKMGIPFTGHGRQAIAAYIRDNPREVRPAYQYRAGDRDRIDAERKMFERYQNFFGVTSEV